MKKNAIFLICLIISIMAIGQSETQNPKADQEQVKVTPPKFTGIENGAAILEIDNSLFIRNYLCENVHCNGYAIDCWQEGTEIVQFTVTPTGNVTNFKVINSVSSKIDKELIRVLKTTDGMWKPGIVDGEPTAMEKEVSMLFKAGDYSYSELVEHFNKKALKYFQEGNIHLFVRNKPKKAVRLYDKGVQYRPNDKALLLLRGICSYEMGDTEGAQRDWDRIATLGGIDPGKLDDELAGMKGYSKMTNILAEKVD